MTDIQLEQVLPGDIERRSFEIIQEELSLQGIHLEPENEMVIKRAIHTTADFDYAQNLVFSGQAVKKGTEALKAGAVIVTDTNMGLSGINKKGCPPWAGKPSVLWQMRMWPCRQRNRAPPELWPAWRRRPGSTGCRGVR